MAVLRKQGSPDGAQRNPGSVTLPHPGFHFVSSRLLDGFSVSPRTECLQVGGGKGNAPVCIRAAHGAGFVWSPGVAYSGDSDHSFWFYLIT